MVIQFNPLTKEKNISLLFFFEDAFR